MKLEQPCVLETRHLFEELHERLGWRWLAGQSGERRGFMPQTVEEAGSSADLVGYLNFIHQNRIQVLGWRELQYFDKQTQDAIQVRLHEINELNPPLVVVAEGLSAPPWLVAFCDKVRLPLLGCDLMAARLIELLLGHLSKVVAPKITRHGVFLDILGMGVLITGESGLGKSELGLELISRGGGLVADDCVDLARIAPTTIEGRCPELLKNLLEVRGVGLLDIKAIYGETSVRRSMRLKLIAQLIRQGDNQALFDRLPTEPVFEEVLDVKIRKVFLPVEAGRNLAVLVESAVRNTILQLRGVDTMAEFIARQRAAMQADQG